MDRTSSYYQQVQLLVSVLPLVATEDIFALKGGTAINLFVRDFPRLSVDIDLVYLPLKLWDEALKECRDALDRIAQSIEEQLKGAKVIRSYLDNDDSLRLIVKLNSVGIKVELSPVLRGTVFEPELRVLTESVEDEFGHAEMRVVSIADLYAGKICAALDRQHPRDLFDIKELMANEGLTDDIRQAFLVYLISHNRSPDELLSPLMQPIEEAFSSTFEGMTFEPVTVEELTIARDELIELINQSLLDSEKQFLLSFYRGKPDWNLLPFGHIKDLPAVKWKSLNLDRMSQSKRRQSIKTLENILGIE